MLGENEADQIRKAKLGSQKPYPCISRCSMESYILTYNRLRQKEPLIILSSHREGGGSGVRGGGEREGGGGKGF